MAAPPAAPPLTGPIGLEDSIIFAVANHPRLQQSQSELRASQARVQEAEGAYWPKLSAGLYSNVGNTPMIVSGLAEPPYWTTLPGGGLSLNLSLMLPLYTGGRLQARMEQAEAEQRAELARTALALRAVTRDVRAAFYESLQASARVETARWKVEQLRELLLVTRQKIEAGSLAAYVERRLEADAAGARQELNRALAEEQVARVTLNEALGAPYDSAVEPAQPPRIAAPTRSLADDVQWSLQERPDLVVARALIEAANGRLQQTLAAYSPQLSLYSMGEQMRAAGAIQGGYQVGLVMSWSLFDGERGPRSDEAQALLEARQYELTRLERVVAGEVARSRARLEAALQNRELALTELDAAAAELHVARIRFQVGRGIHLEILDALAAEVRARNNVVAALRDSGVTEAEFLYSTGRFQ